MICITPSFRKIINRFLQSAVIWIWALTALRLANFVIVLPIALRNLPPDLMGLWYLMLNIVGGVTLVEFGMTASISRQASYLYAASSPQGTLGEERTGPNFSGIHGLILLSHRIYSGLSILVLFLFVTGGAWLAITHPYTMIQPIPIASFLLMLIAGVIRMRGLYWNPLLFGMQRVRESQRIQLTGVLISYAITVIGLLAGAGLLALAAGQCANLIYPMARSKHIFKLNFPVAFKTTPQTIEWKPIWSATWQTGVILLGTWLGTQGMILACGQTNSLEKAASFSLCFLVAFTIHSLAASWLLTRYPTMSILWAEQKFEALRSLVASRITLALTTYISGALLAWIILPHLLLLIGSKTHSLPQAELSLLFVVAGIDLFVSSHSSILIAGNFFPQKTIMLFVGFITFFACIVSGMTYEIRGMLLAPILCQGISTLWIVPYLCWKRLYGTGTVLAVTQNRT